MKILCWGLMNTRLATKSKEVSVEHLLLSSELNTGVNSREAAKAVGQSQHLLPCSAGL